MFVYTIVSYEPFESPEFNIVCAREDIETLRKRLKKDVKAYVENEGYDAEDFIDRGLTPIRQTDDFWMDEDEDTGAYVEYHIFEVPVI